MNYIGSKYKLLSFLYNSINSVIDEDTDKEISDLFAGTGTVGKFFKGKGYKVQANDLQYYSYVLNRNYIGNSTDLHFLGLVEIIPDITDTEITERKYIVIEYLGNIDGKEGFIYNNYAPGGKNNQEYKRSYFTDTNAKKCDGIRIEIENWKKKKIITESEYMFLLASLLESIDKVANTASIYGAYLKCFKKSASKEMILQAADFSKSEHKNSVYNEEVTQLISNTKHNIVYLDPPYNERQYSSNYHILETIARYDNPEIRGKTGMRDYSEQKSEFCRKKEAIHAFRTMIRNLKAKYIFLSYNDEGILSFDEIKEIMSERGQYGCFTKDYQRFKADSSENRNHKKESVIEYLHYVKVAN